MKAFGLLLIGAVLALSSGCTTRLLKHEGVYHARGCVVTRNRANEGTPLPLEYTYYINRHGEQVKHGLWRVNNLHGLPWLERTYHHGRAITLRQYSHIRDLHILMHQEWRQNRYIEEIMYWPNGDKRFHFMHFDGRYHGLQSYWHENGNMQRTIHYNLGAKHGLDREYNETGCLEREREWNNGRPHDGEFIFVYSEDDVEETEDIPIEADDDAKSQQESQLPTEPMLTRYIAGVPQAKVSMVTKAILVRYTNGAPQTPLPDKEPVRIK